MGGLSWWHWLIIAGAFIIIFGAKKLPDAARGVGRSLRILKSEVSAMQDDDDKAKKAPERDRRDRVDGDTDRADHRHPGGPGCGPAAGPRFSSQSRSGSPCQRWSSSRSRRPSRSNNPAPNRRCPAGGTYCTSLSVS